MCVSALCLPRIGSAGKRDSIHGGGTSEATRYQSTRTATSDTRAVSSVQPYTSRYSIHVRGCSSLTPHVSKMRYGMVDQSYANTSSRKLHRYHTRMVGALNPMHYHIIVDDTEDVACSDHTLQALLVDESEAGAIPHEDTPMCTRCFVCEHVYPGTATPKGD